MKKLLFILAVLLPLIGWGQDYNSPKYTKVITDTTYLRKGTTNGALNKIWQWNIVDDTMYYNGRKILFNVSYDSTASDTTGIDPTCQGIVIYSTTGNTMWEHAPIIDTITGDTIGCQWIDVGTGQWLRHDYYLYPKNIRDSVAIGDRNPRSKFFVKGDIYAINGSNRNAIRGEAIAGSGGYFTATTGKAVYGHSHTGAAGWFDGKLKGDSIYGSKLWLSGLQFLSPADSVLVIKNGRVYRSNNLNLDTIVISSTDTIYKFTISHDTISRIDTISSVDTLYLNADTVYIDHFWSQNHNNGKRWLYAKDTQDSVGIGTITPNAKLAVNGNIYAIVGGVYSAVSGVANMGYGINGISTLNRGVNGSSTSGTGGYFSSTSGNGLYSSSKTGYAGVFSGRLKTDTLYVTRPISGSADDTILTKYNGLVRYRLASGLAGSSNWTRYPEGYLKPTTAGDNVHLKTPGTAFTVIQTGGFAAPLIQSMNYDSTMEWGRLVMDSLNNVGLGMQTLLSITSGQANMAIGGGNLALTTSGILNTAIGGPSMGFNTTGSLNTAVGGNTLEANTTGNGNTAIGVSAGDTIGTLNGNIYLGRLAGYNNTLDSTLWIDSRDSRDTTNAFIYGNLEKNWLRLNADVSIKNEPLKLNNRNVYSYQSLVIMAVDTSMLADSTFGVCVSDGWVIDTLLFTIYSPGTATATAHLYYGTNWTSAGTSVVTAGNTITAEGTLTKVYSFNNATIPVDNFLWLKFTGTITFKTFICQVKGHRL